MSAEQTAAAGETWVSPGLFAFLFDEPKRGDRLFDLPKICNGQRLFPLLGGEGQGEGEREHKLLLCLP